MADPTVLLSERFAAGLARLDPALAGADPVVRRCEPAGRGTDGGRRGDYQVNGAMALAKRLGRPPRELASALVGSVDIDDVVGALDVAGPGFINLTLRDGYLAGALGAMLGDPRLGVRRVAAPETVVVDYSAPNVAKEMHVGHLRSTIIGDSVVRILDFCGHRTIRQNHLGDWGTPFGMLIEHLCDVGEAEAAEELSVGELSDFYRAARESFDGDAGFADRARRRVVALQSGDPATLALWRLLVDESSRYFGAVYERLGVLLGKGDEAGESVYNDRLADVADALARAGLLVESDGAQCVFPPGFSTRSGDPLPLIVRKSDGGFGYAATDLAALRYRLDDLGASRVVYVVGAPQREHLEMVFAVARQAGWLVPPARAVHVAFGSVLGADRKMFRTRAGATVRLIDLLDEAVERAGAVVAAKNPELSAEERSAIATAVGIGAVKYADLANDRVKDYVFDWDRMLDLAGNSAPYLQYAHARIRSIFRQAAGRGIDTGAELAAVAAKPPADSLAPAERALAIELLCFDGAVEAAAGSLQPHRICTHLIGLASAFTGFYETCPVLRADPEPRALRLLLCELTARVIATGLDLLGIGAPERM